jgi:hypothetical protein
MKGHSSRWKPRTLVRGAPPFLRCENGRNRVEAPDFSRGSTTAFVVRKRLERKMGFRVFCVPALFAGKPWDSKQLPKSSPISSTPSPDATSSPHLPAPVFHDPLHHIKIFHGDCLEILTAIPSCFLLRKDTASRARCVVTVCPAATRPLWSAVACHRFWRIATALAPLHLRFNFAFLPFSRHSPLATRHCS